MLGCRIRRACINLRFSSDAPRNEFAGGERGDIRGTECPAQSAVGFIPTALFICAFAAAHQAVFDERRLSRCLRLPLACVGRPVLLRANPVVARVTRPLHSPFPDLLVGDWPSARHGDELDDRGVAVLGNRCGERMGGRFRRRVRGHPDRPCRWFRGSHGSHGFHRLLHRAARPSRNELECAAAERNRRTGSRLRCFRRSG